MIDWAVVLAYFAGVLVGAWGGIGVTEAALTGLYVQIGLPPDQAAAGALLHRAVFYAVVLAWVLGLSPNVLVIPGARTIAHTLDSIAAADIQLTPEEAELYTPKAVGEIE